MYILGIVFLAVILFLCAFAAAVALVALKLNAETAKKVLSLSKRTVIIAAGLSVAVLIVLITAFLRNDFSIAVVSKHSSTELPIFYKLIAVWAGSAGSFVFWAHSHTKFTKA